MAEHWVLMEREVEKGTGWQAWNSRLHFIGLIGSRSFLEILELVKEEILLVFGEDSNCCA